eukprot:9660918-Alexandrium_andersonii.AAC.1
MRICAGGLWSRSPWSKRARPTCGRLGRCGMSSTSRRIRGSPLRIARMTRPGGGGAKVRMRALP